MAIAVGVGLACVAVAAAVPMVPTLLLAILLGMLLRNLRLLPGSVVKGASKLTRPTLRVGIVLLGLQLSLGALGSLGWEGLTVITITVAVTFLGTIAIGRMLRVARGLTLLVATGFAICGASAVAAMSSVIGSEEESETDTAQAVALVTIFGTICLFVLPMLQPLSGFSDEMMGLWIGSSVHEVAQVVASAATVSAAALAVATIAKLGRVVLLAPLVAGVSMVIRRQRPVGADRARPPIVPLFVLGFLAMMLIRTLLPVPQEVLGVASLLTSALLATAMFGLGLAVDLRNLISTGGRALVLGLASTLIAVTVSYAAITLLS